MRAWWRRRGATGMGAAAWGGGVGGAAGVGAPRCWAGWAVA
jgi:hypothetical protein